MNEPFKIPNYLFAPNPEDPQNFLDRIYRKFFQLSVQTDAKLFLLFDSQKQVEPQMAANLYRATIVFRDEVDLADLMSQVDVLITGDNPDEEQLIEMAWKNRIKVVSFRYLGENVFRDFPIISESEEYKSEMNQFFKQNLFDIFPMADYEYLLAHQGIGEMITLCFLMKEYKKRIGKKIFLICFDRNRADLLQKCPYIDSVATVPMEIYAYLKYFYPFKDFLNLHIDRKLRARVDELYSPYSEENRILKRVKIFFDLEPEVPLHRYSVEIDPEDLKIARKVFDELNLRVGRTIFIVTNGFYYSNLNHHRDFFIRLAKKFRELGFDLVTNSPREEIPSVPNVFLPFWQSAAFTHLCGNIASVQTGWVEAACVFSPIPIKACLLIPNAHEQFYKQDRELLTRLKLYGDDFVDVEIKQYQNFYDQIFPHYIRYSLHKFAESKIEEEFLIESIVQNISR